MGEHATLSQPTGRFLRLKAGARVAGVSRSTLDRAVERGEVPFAVIDGERFFLRDDLIAWAEARREARQDEHD